MDFVKNFLLREHALRGFGATEYAVDDLFLSREPVLLEPEGDGALAAPPLSLERPSKQAISLRALNQ